MLIVDFSRIDELLDLRRCFYIKAMVLDSMGVQYRSSRDAASLKFLDVDERIRREPVIVNCLDVFCDDGIMNKQ
jgi:hypothetical protein